jgi:hypothetical protein
VQILVQYTLTPAEALRGTRAFKRRWYILSMGSGALLVLGGRATLQAPGGHNMALLMILNGLLFLVLPELALRWARLRRGAQAYQPTVVSLDDEGLTLRTDASEGSLPWAAFAEVQRSTGFWIFRVNRRQAVFVPERALAEADGRALEAFLRERKLLKP